MMPAAILRPATRHLFPPRHAALGASILDGILRTEETEGPRLPAVVTGEVASLDGGEHGDGFPPPAGVEGAMVSGLDACLEILSGEEDGPLTKGVWSRLMAALSSCRVQSAPRECEVMAAVTLDPDALAVEETVRTGAEGLEEQLIPDARLLEVCLGPRGRRVPDWAGPVEADPGEAAPREAAPGEAAPGEAARCLVRSACPPDAPPCLSLRGTLSESLFRDLEGASGRLVLLLSPPRLPYRASTSEETAGPVGSLHSPPHVMLGVMATPPFRDTG